MKDRKAKIANVAQTIARVWGTLILVFVLVMGLGSSLEAMGKGTLAWDLGLEGWREIASFLAFPVSTVVGLALALRWEGLGGAIVVGGVVALFVLRPELLTFKPWFWLGVAAPGVLYLTSWFLTRRESESQESQTS